MNYLIQAYACSPSQGGEYAVSWGWISHLDSLVNDNDNIYVLSLTLTNQHIEDAKLKHVKILSVNGMEKYNFLNYNVIYYQIWLNKAYKVVRELNEKIDVVHIYSLSDFRQPGKWYKLKDVYTIWGPVGGGQTCPKSLRCYDNLSGIIRGAINYICGYNPFLRKNINKFSKVYVCNNETLHYLKNAKLLIDVPLNDKFKNLEIESRDSEIPIIMFAGRLINKKGLIFFLDALTYIDKSLNYQVYIYGDGDQKQIISDKIVQLGLETKVFLKGKTSYNEMSNVYKKADIFVLPSLRESGGSVLIEAMAHKLPIVSLNMSMSRVLSKKKCGLFVDINQSREDILKQFSDNLTTLIKNPQLRELYGSNGYEFVNKELTWECMIKEVYKDFLNSEIGHREKN